MKVVTFRTLLGPITIDSNFIKSLEKNSDPNGKPTIIHYKNGDKSSIMNSYDTALKMWTESLERPDSKEWT